MTDQQSALQPQKTGGLWIVFAVLLAIVTVGLLWWWKSAKPLVALCEPKNLSLSAGEIETVEKMRSAHITVINYAAESCMLKGHPTASVLNSKGEKRLVSTAQNDPSYAPDGIVLAPKGQAHTVIRLPNSEDADAALCSNGTSALWVYLPGQDIALTPLPLTVSLSAKICSGFSLTAFKQGP